MRLFRVTKLAYYVLLFIGSRYSKCQTKEKNLRYNKCPGGDWSHRKKEQKLYQVEGKDPGLRFFID